MESELDYKDFNKIGRKSPYTAYHDQTTERSKEKAETASMAHLQFLVIRWRNATEKLTQANQNWVILSWQLAPHGSAGAAEAKVQNRPM